MATHGLIAYIKASDFSGDLATTGECDELDKSGTNGTLRAARGSHACYSGVRARPVGRLSPEDVAVDVANLSDQVGRGAQLQWRSRLLDNGDRCRTAAIDCGAEREGTRFDAGIVAGNWFSGGRFPRSRCRLGQRSR